MADKYSVPYIDMRQAFVDSIPSYWIYYKGYVTEDGEHENERGTQIVADLIATELNTWLLQR